MSCFRLAVVLGVFVVACGCSETRRAQVPDGGQGLPDSGSEDGDGGPVLTRTVSCSGDTGDGAHRAFHQVLRYSDGSASTSCSISGPEGTVSSTASYYYGQTGQPGGDCFAQLTGSTTWRLTLAQDESVSIVSRFSGSSSTVPCTTR